jgi:hypothetical protein
MLVFAVATAPASAAEFSVTALGGYERLAASDSAKAVFESSGGAIYGGEIAVDLGGGVFAGAGVRTFSKTGERAFVADPAAPVFRLGFPLTIRVTPVYALGGYRFGDERRSLRPYIAGGLGVSFYKERSDVAGVVETTDSSKFSALAMLGL